LMMGCGEQEREKKMAETVKCYWSTGLLRHLGSVTSSLD